ncbi:hypothetical protein ACIQVL_05380 [Streptomyces sp. NPDC090499]|uniref:hypothetical protein n=1 Tax=Streptomyces sp. NPDC090499 TaxID=3365965 RepID=UPI00382CC2D0
MKIPQSGAPDGELGLDEERIRRLADEAPHVVAESQQDVSAPREAREVLEVVALLKWR